MVKKDCVSVIIPVYNRENMIGIAIESVLSQSYSNLELIVVDDGSTDKTKDVIRSFKDIRISLIEANHNGAYAARNIGIENAKGEYIAFLDSDDIWLPEKLAKQVAVARRKEEGFVFTNGFVLMENNNEYRMNIFLTADRDICGGKCYTELLRHNFIATSSVILSRNIIDNVGYFIAENRGVLDYDMWLRIARKYEIDYIAQPLFLYKSHADRLSTNRVARLHDSLYIYDLQRKICTQHGLKNEEKTIRRSVAETHMRLGLIHYSTGEGNIARKYFYRVLAKGDTAPSWRIWALGCLFTPYPIYRWLYNHYKSLRTELKEALGDKITPKGILKYMYITILTLMLQPKRTSG